MEFAVVIVTLYHGYVRLSFAINDFSLLFFYYYMCMLLLCCIVSWYSLDLNCPLKFSFLYTSRDIFNFSFSICLFISVFL